MRAFLVVLHNIARFFRVLSQIIYNKAICFKVNAEVIVKILLTTLNSKYIHSNLALRYLRETCPEEDILLKEYTINDRLEVVAGDIYRTGAQILGFSCYIWNITETLQIINTLKQVAPGIVIILGGPEVSYNPSEYLAQGADYVVIGEGEQAFPKLIDILKITSPTKREELLANVKGLAYETEQGTCINPPRDLIKDLGGIPSPYTTLDGLEHKIAYVESSRGCPFNCQYCLSSTIQGVRFFPLERTKEELQKLISAGVRQIKFVDRTFNCNKQHALELWSFIKDWHPEGNFHFEIAGDLLDAELLEFLQDVPKGLFQFEVGVQSTNLRTLELIDRKTDLDKLSKNVMQVATGKNIMQLLDLIAGLPEEDYASFGRSFNAVYSWGPDKLHLGFLKLLQGSGVRRKVEQWGFKFNTEPPYQVLASNWLSYEELLRLQIIEDLVDKYFNSGRYKYSLTFLVNQQSGDAFGLFEKLAIYWESKGYHRQAHNAKVLFQLLWDFYLEAFPEQRNTLFAELLKLDYLLLDKPSRTPDWISFIEPPFFRERSNQFFQQGLLRLMPQLKELSKREINKHFHLDSFSPQLAGYLELPLISDGEEPLYLLFYYPGQLLKADSPGFIPVVI
jgi:radical SAM superfamily enzyme YgiQ (UPF0313 family)